MIHPTTRRPAMTAVELLVATALAAMLMGVVCGILASMTRQQRALLDRRSYEPWQTRLVAALEWDLQNSQLIHTTHQGIQLQGFAGRDFASNQPLHRPTAISYLIVNIEGRNWLVRREAHTDALQMDNSRTELVCVGVQQIVATRPGQKIPPPTSSSASAPETIAIPDGPLPGRMDVVILRAGTTDEVFRHGFVFRP